MKISFAYKGRYHVQDSVTIEYLSAIAKSHGFNTSLAWDQDLFGVTDNVLHLPAINRIFSSESRRAADILDSSPELVVFIDEEKRYGWNRRVARALKSGSSGIKTVIITRALTDGLLNDFDHVLNGEAEAIFPGFLGSAMDRKEYSSGGLADLDKLPIPDKSLFERFVNFKDSYMIYASRGCRFGCSYCQETVNKDIIGAGYPRRRSPANVIAELEAAKSKYGIKEVIFKDPVFIQDKLWLTEFLPQYKQRVGVPYKCFARPELMNKETAERLQGSGCYCVEFGVQTLNEAIKNVELERGERRQELINAFSACDETDLRYDIDYMFGLPGETVGDHKGAAVLFKGLKKLNRIKCHNLICYENSKLNVVGNEASKNDFFSRIAGSKEMKRVNAGYQKLFKILPLLPRALIVFLTTGDGRILRFLPMPAVYIAQAIVALKNRDLRFKVYLKYYPLKIKWALK